MKEILENNIQTVWAVSDVLAVIICLVMVHYGSRAVTKRFPQSAALIASLTHITRVFLVLMGGLLLSYLFFEREVHEELDEHKLRVIWFGFVALATVITSAITQGYFRKKGVRVEQGDTTLYKYVSHLSVLAIYAVGIILILAAIPGLEKFATAAGASAGALALIAGVASQEGIANLVGGLFIAVFKPFRLGDVIRVGNDIVGHVEDINLRHTVIKNFQNKRVVIPNAAINKEHVTNYNLVDERNCEWVDIGIAYNASIADAVKIIREESEKHESSIDARTEKQRADGFPVVDVQVIELAESSVTLRAWVWSRTYIEGFRMRNQLFRIIKERFDAEGIEIPFPHRTLVFKDDPSGKSNRKKLTSNERPES